MNLNKGGRTMPGVILKENKEKDEKSGNKEKEKERKPGEKAPPRPTTDVNRA